MGKATPTSGAKVRPVAVAVRPEKNAEMAVAKISDFGGACRWLLSRVDVERLTPTRAVADAMKLGRMERLMGLLGNPHREFKSVHVAGTKGKGSTCEMAAAALEACGYTVGLYTSPHLADVRERIRLNRNKVTEGEFVGLARRVLEAEGGLEEAEGEPTFFWLIAAMAFWSFADQAAGANARPVFYEVSRRNLALWVELGLTLHKVGEEAVVRLPGFSLAGSRFKAMRAALSKRQRDGYDIAVMSGPHDTASIEELRPISEAWLEGKMGREKGFSVGRFDPDYLARFDIAVVRRDGRIVAFANILASSSGRFVAVDLMRYVPAEASGLMEFMFLGLIEHYKAKGAEEFSLGTAPLAGLSERSVARSWNRFGRLIYRHGGAFYNFEGLRAFKQKFQPEWRPRYLALPPSVSPLLAMRDVALLIAGSARGLIAK